MTNHIVEQTAWKFCPKIRIPSLLTASFNSVEGISQHKLAINSGVKRFLPILCPRISRISSSERTEENVKHSSESLTRSDFRDGRKNSSESSGMLMLSSAVKKSWQDVVTEGMQSLPVSCFSSLTSNGNARWFAMLAPSMPFVRIPKLIRSQ
jgi:hypothetical protein